MTLNVTPMDKSNPVRILVVDDEPDLEALIRQRFRRQIRTGEYVFEFASNGAHALKKLGPHPDVDIILTDINMPEMDGLTLLAELAKLEGIFKSVVVSAYGDMTNIRTAMNRGAFDFLTKPIDFTDLEITIAKTISELNSLREGYRAKSQLSSVEKEIEVAAKIQQTILHKTFPPFPHRREFDIFAQMLPAHQVGGDFYDFYFIDQRRLGFVIGDVAGKGVPAAIFMAVTRSLVKATALTGLEPDLCLRHVNRLLCSDSDGTIFVTLFYGILDVLDGSFRYANAGHNPPWIIRPDGNVRELDNQGGVVLGILADASYSAGSDKLAAEETLFLYTDGVTEAMNQRHELYGEERLAALLRKLPDAAPDALCKRIVTDIRRHAKQYPQHDDVTMLAVKYLGHR